MGRKHLKGVKKSRSVGHRPKYNKKSVKERRRLRLLTNDKLLNEYFYNQQRANK